jgi:hypothetical protein
MMNSNVARLEFSKAAVTTWKFHDEKHGNWPVVYVLDDGRNTAQANPKKTEGHLRWRIAQRRGPTSSAPRNTGETAPQEYSRHYR